MSLTIADAPRTRLRGDRIATLFAAVYESAIGPKRTWVSAPHMSAIGIRADIGLFAGSLGHVENILTLDCRAAPRFVCQPPGPSVMM